MNLFWNSSIVLKEIISEKQWRKVSLQMYYKKVFKKNLNVKIQNKARNKTCGKFRLVTSKIKKTGIKVISTSRDLIR